MRRGRVYRRCTKCNAEVGRHCPRCRTRLPERSRRCPSCGTDTSTASRQCARCGSTSVTWCYRVDVGRPGEARRQSYRAGFATKAEAVEALTAEQNARSEGTYLEPSKITVGEYLDRWLASGADGVRGSTLKGYDVCVRVHIVPRIGSITLQGLTRVHVRALYQELATSSTTKGVPTPEHLEHLRHVAERYRTYTAIAPRSAVRMLRTELDRPEATIRHWIRRCRELGLLRDRPAPPAKAKRPLAPKTVHNVHVCLRRALETARADGLIKTNPAAGAHRAPKDGPEMLTWSEEEVVTFLESVAGGRDAAFWRLALDTGMRKGELLGLRRRDLDLGAGLIHVRQQWARQHNELVFGPPKTKKAIRTIEVDAGTARALRDHLAAQEFERRSWGKAYRGDLDLVFCQPSGEPIDPDVLRHRFEHLVKRAGVTRIRFHDIRHTNATLLLGAGEDVKAVSERLGHASVNVTLTIYHHVKPRAKASVASKIGAILDKCARSVHDSDSETLTNDDTAGPI